MKDKDTTAMPSSSDYDFPESTRHDFPLSVGRTLSYYTFDTTPTNNNPKPVLYLHGFPGMGLEGGVCASAVAEAGGKLYAPDRPGFGHSSPYPSNLTEDERVESFVNDLWEFIEDKKWEFFSVIAVSGAGPFVLAFLATYLDRQSSSEGSTAIPKLDAVSLVAVVCCSAGTDDMMKMNQQLFSLVANNSLLSRTSLKLMFGLQRFLMNILPTSWVLKLIPMSDLPQVDKDVISHPQVGMYMAGVGVMALRQSASAPMQEACVIFRAKQACEDSLRRHCNDESSTAHFPNMGVFQGDLDVNVPKAHAMFVHQQLLCEKSTLREYSELGHASLVVGKATDYAQFALTPPTNQ